MADKLIIDSRSGGTDVIEANWGPYYTGTQNGVHLSVDGASDLWKAVTTDGGSNFTTTEIVAATIRNLNVFPDMGVPGDSGTLLHAAYLDFVESDLKYINVATDGTVGTLRDVDSTLTVNTNSNLNKIAITKTVSGNIIIIGQTQTESFGYVSADNFATAGTAINDPYDTIADEDHLYLFPANTSDNDDCCALFWDRSGNELKLFMYDAGTNTWDGGTSIATSMIDDNRRGMCGAVRHSDGHLIVVAHTDSDSAGDDLKCWDINPGDTITITAKTNIKTAIAECGDINIAINQQTDDIYVNYYYGTTWQADVDMYYSKSTDGGATWGTEVQFNEDASGDFRFSGGPMSITDAGGRYQPAYYNDDTLEIYTNLTDVEIPAASGGASLDADSISSASTVGTPSLTKGFAGTSDSISSASTVGTPSLTKGFAGTPDSISSASTVGTPSLQENYQLAANSISSASTVGNPSTGGALGPDSISSASTVGTPTLGFTSLVLPPVSGRKSDLRVTVNGADYSLPDNWRELSINYDFNGLDLVSNNLPSEMVYCGKQPYADLQTRVNENICGEITINVDVICWPAIPDWESLYEANAKLSDASFTCGVNPSCQVSIAATRFNAFTVLEAASTDEICLQCSSVSTQTDTVKIRQIQSGGKHKEVDGIADVTACFLPIDELIAGLVDELGFTSGSGIPQGVWAYDFHHNVNRLTIPDTSDTTISVTVTSLWGTQHIATVNFIGGESLDDRAELVQKSLLLRTYGGTSALGFSPVMNQVFHDISAIWADSGNNNISPAIDSVGVGNRASGQLDIITDWPVESIIAIGDVNGLFAVSELQPYRYGLGRMMFSTNGLLSDATCMSWAELKGFMTCVHPTVFVPTDKNFTYAGYDEYFNSQTLAVTQPALQPRSVKWKIREDIQHAKGLFGQRSILENVEEADSEWKWYGNEVNLHTGLTGIASGPYFVAGNGLPANDVVVHTVGASEAGPAFLRGAVIITNNAACAAEITFQLYRNTATAANLLYDTSTKGDVSAGQTVNLNLGAALDNSVIPSLNPLMKTSTIVGNEPVCLNVGDQLILRIEVLNPTGCTDLGVTFSPGPVTNLKNPDWRYETTEADEGWPLITDETAFVDFEPYYDFTDFSSCVGIRDCELSESFYTGVGYAFTQQLEALNDYGETVFVTFRAPTGLNDGTINNGDDQTWMFERQWYFNTLGTPPNCFDERIVSYYYHNMIIQHPWIASEWAKYVPSNFAGDRWVYTNEITSTGGGGLEPTVNSAGSNYLPDTGLIPKAHSRVKLYEMEDCHTLLNYVFRGLEKAAQFSNCGNGTVVGIIRKMSKQIDGQGLTTFIIEAE